jgi:hypothetical protein
MQLNKANENIKALVMMIHNFFDVTEKDGLGSVKPHSSLQTMDLIKISIKNNIGFGKGSKQVKTNPQRLELTVYHNMLIWELRELIAKIYDIDTLMIKLERSSSLYMANT